MCILVVNDWTVRSHGARQDHDLFWDVKQGVQTNIIFNSFLKSRVVLLLGVPKSFVFADKADGHMWHRRNLHL